MTKQNTKTLQIIRQHIANGNIDAAKRMAEFTIRSITSTKQQQEFIKAVNGG